MLLNKILHPTFIQEKLYLYAHQGNEDKSDATLVQIIFSSPDKGRLPE